MLYALDSLNALNEADVLHALGDPHPQVRRHGLRLSEPMLDKSAGRSRKGRCRSRRTLILSFSSNSPCRWANATMLRQRSAIAYILIHDSKNRDIMDAALTSIVDRAGGVLKLLLADGKWSASPPAGTNSHGDCQSNCAAAT